MSEGLVNFEILLDKPTATYSPGEMILGKLIIDVNRRKTLTELKVRFKGECKIQWTEHQRYVHHGSSGTVRSQRHFRYHGTETYFRDDVYIFRLNDTMELNPGKHVFPFSYNLPRKNLPSNFAHSIGNIRYSIKAMFKRPWGFDHTVSKLIVIEAPTELEEAHLHDENGIDEMAEKTFRNCLLPYMSAGRMWLRYRIPTTIFGCGDDVVVTININNESSSVDVTRINMKLEQALYFHADTPYPKSTSDVTTIQEMNKLGPFTKEDEIRIDFQVPQLPSHSSFRYCRFIDINYSLYIEVHVSGCHRSIERVFNVLIGPRRSIQPDSCQSSCSVLTASDMTSTPQLKATTRVPISSGHSPHRSTMSPDTNESLYKQEQF